jgi:Na+/proline symporter
MTIAVILSLGVSVVLYLAIGMWYGAGIRSLGDMLPVLRGGRARVANHREFAASTVAATISLATVVVAFYELVPGLGFWLLWTAITTALGLLLFGALTTRIWTKMAVYKYRPTLHAYLGEEFGSPNLALVASIFTAIGYLSAFAVELTVGSRFLAGMLPNVPQLPTAIALSIVSFIYSAQGGFRVVVVSDRIQMWFIWLLIAALGAYYAFGVEAQGWPTSIQRIPDAIRVPTWNQGLLPFVLGIAVMNLLTYISNMGLWQRVAGSQAPEVVTRGMWSSVAISALSWSLLVCTAVGAFMFVAPVPNENLLITLLHSMQGSVFGRVVIFCVVLGLYGAMLSTASTQLVAVSHTIYEDIIGPFRRAAIDDRAQSSGEVFWSRLILVASALVAVVVVEMLRMWGLTVADLAFAVYGAALGLVPPIMLTLFRDRHYTRRLSVAATVAVALGFLSCWSAAIWGRAAGNGNVVFLSPIISTVVATAVMAIGHLRMGTLPADVVSVQQLPPDGNSQS